MKKTLVIILITLFFLSFARGETNNPVLDEALLHLGKPYVYATMGPDTFDCSGFVCYCYKKIENIELQRSAYSQGYDKTYPKIVKIEELKPGDVVFFNTNNSDGDLSDHSGLYLGNGEFIHCSSGKGKVIISTLLEGFYNERFSWGRRIKEVRLYEYHDKTRYRR